MPENKDMQSQQDIFSVLAPPARHYPMNVEGQQQTISFIREDIRESGTYLIITGYSSLDFLIRELGNPKLNARNCVEVVLGNEPLSPANSAHTGSTNQRGGMPTRYGAIKPHSLPEEIREYWLAKGISILLNGPVLNLIEKIRYGKVSFFYRSNLHAKVYKGDGAAMLGSSNFSEAGMKRQYEANVRREFGEEGFLEIADIADFYRNGATAWNEEIIRLLEELLRMINWQEALSRSVALILEGQWMDKYPDAWRLNRSTKLWPTQRKGIAQALYLLERQGSVLVADPTGSGKTRMGARLLEALLNKLWVQLKPDRSRYMIICPPLVKQGWKRELGHLNWNTSEPVSHGLLSNPDRQSSAEALDSVKQAHILLIDEAHNYLNKTSARSRSVVINRADHIILFTATPINRRSDDLLRLVEILGLDNLDDAAYKTYNELQKSRDNRSPEKMDQLRSYVNRFMVRRTKKELNEAVDKEPDSYTDIMGNPCRYPQSMARMYNTAETETDREIAAQIEELIQNLKGIIYITNLTADGYDLQSEAHQEAFLKKRLSMGAALSRYNIRNMLRSSRAALVEHLSGTAEAMEIFGIRSFKQGDTGDIVGRISQLSEELPKTNLSIDLPDYFTNEEKWLEACEQEAEVLRQIKHLATQMSPAREKGKAEQIINMINQHEMLLVYDTALITLNYMNQLLEEKGYGKQVMVVTGSTASTKKLLTSSFALEASGVKMAALCSDALSEGVNLQRASAVLFLDMPSVIRIAEQRIGRVERMDSPHDKVYVYWPDDSDEFRLKTDRSFYQRHQMVENLIGSNITLPEELEEREQVFTEESLTAQQVISVFEDHQKEDRSWEGFEDAFSALKGLVSGPKALVDDGLYEQVAGMQHTTGTWISVVESTKDFVFTALQGSGTAAPSWLLKFDGNTIMTEINQIARWLRKELQGAEEADFDKTAEHELMAFTRWLSKNELDMLPNKKRHALSQMKKMITAWTKKETDPERQKLLKELHRITNEKVDIDDFTPDWYELADRWLDLAQPKLIHWLEKERKTRRYQNIRLENINGYLKKNPFTTEELEYLLEALPLSEPISTRMHAVIIGISRRQSND